MKRGLACLVLLLFSQTAFADISQPTKRDRERGMRKSAVQSAAPAPAMMNNEDVLYLDAIQLLQKGQMPAARAKLAQLESVATSVDLKAEAAVAVGDSYYEENDLDNAFNSYQSALARYPGNEQTEALRPRLAELRSRRSGKAGAPATPVRNALSVQVGSFSHDANATRLVAKLKAAGYDAYSVKPDRLYRVRVGGVSTRAEAMKLAKRLKADGYPTKINS